MAMFKKINFFYDVTPSSLVESEHRWYLLSPFSGLKSGGEPTMVSTT
jgi:hypothetical protein